MSNLETAPEWERLKHLDIGELNQLNSDVFEARYDSNKDSNTVLAEIFAKHYSYDVKQGTGPYAAVVLDVLSGPQVKNEATTRGRLETTTINIDEYPLPLWKEIKDGNGPTPVAIKAKIPEFDVDIDWPKDNQDKARIDAHGEYHQFRSDDSLEKISVGSIVWVTYDKVPIDGKSSGRIVGVHTIASIADVVTRISAKKSMNPDCNAARHVGINGALYVSHTNPSPSNFGYGPLIRRIKNHIKTGMYGNGLPTTKEHFEAALRASDPSPGFWYQNGSQGPALPGPAPTNNNAFIWIGTLKNNGYLDLLDRPLGSGRETIIYAPMTLDLSSPVEIKYYFHDKAGFGHAHINGPETTVVQARGTALTPGNDFREKIGPAIKDLNKTGRNYILVIPEMSYSRGYGTKNNDVSRINKLSSGQPAGIGATSGETLRTKANQETRGHIKEYLNKLPIETNKNLLHITPLREREFATFDGSFTGGKFGDFHQEVLDVLDEHLGTIYDKIENISVLADGLGGLAMAGIVNELNTSSTKTNGRKSFINAFFGKPLRIDYVTDESMDSPLPYGYYFAGRSPSYVIYENLLLEHSEQAYTEFNYITSPSPAPDSFLFDNVVPSKSKDFEQAGKSGNHERKFYFNIVNSALHTNYISLHIAPEKTKLCIFNVKQRHARR